MGGFKSEKPIKQQRNRKERKIKNLQTSYKEKEIERVKEEHTFEISSLKQEKKIHKVSFGAKSEW